MSIKVLCASCNSHILNTDKIRLDYPLHGEMFDSVNPGWRLRPGLLNLDIFCYVCSAFPFRYNAGATLANIIAPYLNIEDEDGKPRLLSIDQILGRAVITQRKKAAVVEKQIKAKNAVPPCPICGNRAGITGHIIHKKTCSRRAGNDVVVAVVPSGESLDPFLEQIESKVKRGEPGDVNEPPTPEEIAELEADRSMKTEGIGSGRLRPGEGYQPPAR